MLAHAVLRLDFSNSHNLHGLLPPSDAGRHGQGLRFEDDVAPYYNGRTTQGTFPDPAVVEVVVGTLPLATYQFYQLVQRCYDTNGNPFAELAPLRANLTGGYGLFGGATDVRYRIRL